jgi:two-component system, OmpR family, alkaline phosphatase synthesis response regulator PhoP
MSARILLVEDEPGLVLTISDLLAAEGFEVETARDGEEALAKALTNDFALMVLDVMLPKKNGFDVCRELRQRGIDIAILMLTARTQLVDRVVGLKLGADDYLTKPFEPPELLARIGSLLRRIRKEGRAEVRSFRFGAVEVDFERALVHKDGQLISMAAKELQLLRYLINHRDRIVLRGEILQKVWEYDPEVTSRTIDVHIAWLRQKLDAPHNPRHFQTIRGKGYRFTP